MAERKSTKGPTTIYKTYKMQALLIKSFIITSNPSKKQQKNNKKQPNNIWVYGCFSMNIRLYTPFTPTIKCRHHKDQ
jgi:hypothetical protein